jgi:late competence protein required for DNA uptake (superfamily II DNA/RNA helicase)
MSKSDRLHTTCVKCDDKISVPVWDKTPSGIYYCYTCAMIKLGERPNVHGKETL